MPAAHGTRSSYVMGCRCEPCTKANRAYQRAHMAAHTIPASGANPRGYVRADGSIREFRKGS